MQLNVSRSFVFVVLAFAALAAATVVVAGYVDRPKEAAQATLQDKCDGCPLQGTEACCQAKADDSGDAKACPVPSAGGACADEPTSGCPARTEATGCPMSGCQTPVQSPGGAQDCPHAE